MRETEPVNPLAAAFLAVAFSVLCGLVDADESKRFTPSLSSTATTPLVWEDSAVWINSVTSTSLSLTAYQSIAIRHSVVSHTLDAFRGAEVWAEGLPDMSVGLPVSIYSETGKAVRLVSITAQQSGGHVAVEAVRLTDQHPEEDGVGPTQQGKQARQLTVDTGGAMLPSDVASQLIAWASVKLPSPRTVESVQIVLDIQDVWAESYPGEPRAINYQTAGGTLTVYYGEESP